MLAEGLPPGPSLGLTEAVRYVLDLEQLYADCFARYGDPFTLRSPLGPIVVTGDPAHVRAVYTAPAGTLGIWMPEFLEPTLGARSLLVTDGAEHRAQRRMLAPAFHGARMRSIASRIVEATAREVGAWTPGEIDAEGAARRVSLDVILGAVFGVHGEARRAVLRDALVELVDVAPRAVASMQVLTRALGGCPRTRAHVARALGAHGPWAGFSRARARVDALIHAEIAARRAAPPGGHDVLSMLVDARYDDGAELSPGEIRDQLLTLLVAGHETTTIALAWALYEVLRDDGVRARLLDELDASDGTPDALAQLPYLAAVCDETLRLHAVVPDVIRTVVRPFELAGRVLPPGTAVAVAITRVHTRDDVFAEPWRFRPERFLGRSYGPFEFLPFGGGPRRCIGASLAMSELKLVLGTMLRGSRLRLARSGTLRSIRRNITIGPRGTIALAYAGPRRANPARARCDTLAAPPCTAP